MSDETQEPEDGKAKPADNSKLKAAVDKTVEVAEKASNVAEVANNAFSAVKWIAIAIVMLTVLGFGYGAYKLVTKPVIAVTDAAGKMADVVGDKAGAIKDGADNVINRLVIPTQDQSTLDALAEENFELLHNLPTSKPEGIKDRLFRKTNFGDSESKICQMSLNFGGGDLPIFAGADNKGYAKSKSLGSKDDRLVHFVLRTKGDDIPMNVVWDQGTNHWAMKWRASTVKKPLDDATAAARIFDILRETGKQCGS